MLDADPEAIRTKAETLKQMKALYEEINTDIINGLSRLDSYWQGEASDKFVNEFMGQRFPQFVTKVRDRCDELGKAAIEVADKIEESQEQVLALIVAAIAVIGSAIALPAAAPLVGVAVLGLLAGMASAASGLGGLLMTKAKLLTVLDDVTGKPKVAAVSIDRSQTGTTTEETERPTDGTSPGWAPDDDPHRD